MPVRNSTEVAQRVLALMAIIDEARREQLDLMHAWVARHGIARYFTPNEAQFMAARGHATKAVRVDFSWRAEGLMVLVWALGGLDECPPLDRPLTNIASQLIELAARSPEEFIAGARLRPLPELETLDRTLMDASAKLRETRMRGLPDPAGLDFVVVYERSNAIAWVLDSREGWD